MAYHLPDPLDDRQGRRGMQLDSTGGPKLATFARYNVLLDGKWLHDVLGADYSDTMIEKIAVMDDPANMNDLAELGRLAANQQIKPEHFPPAFDL